MDAGRLLEALGRALPGDRIVADADGIVVLAADRRRPVAAEAATKAD